ncbi:MAG: hypothetical protein BWY69_01072 [Planctomycetes bacterium ADurb.Bin401]|nr:MAG: hypothetical protein BWY69_01072 [Planctomycetes bacterium ADurb.Bin401]
MSGFIAIIVAAVFAFWGYHKRLYPAWAFLFNVMVAVYLAVMLTPTILQSNSAGGIILNLLGPWANSAVLLTIAALYLAVSQLASHFYLTNTYCISFPKWVDFGGGIVFAFLGGYILANIMLFALANTPLESNKYTSKIIPDNSGKTLIRTCRYISSLSLQDSHEDILKAEHKIKTLPVIAKKLMKQKPLEAKPDVNQPEPVITARPAGGEKIDVNEQTENLDINNHTIDANINSPLIVQPEVNQPESKSSDVNKPATTHPKTVNEESKEEVPVEKKKVIDSRSGTRRTLKAPRKIDFH